MKVEKINKTYGKTINFISENGVRKSVLFSTTVDAMVDGDTPEKVVDASEKLFEMTRGLTLADMEKYKDDLEGNI